MRGTSLVPRLSRGLFFLAATVAFIMAALPKPPGVPFEPSDKIQHMMAFAILALLARFAFLKTRAAYIFFMLSIFGALIECVQLIPALGRDADFIDWMADNIAVIAVLVACQFYQYLRGDVGRS